MPENGNGINLEKRRQKIKESSCNKKDTKEEDKIGMLSSNQ
jgi:hypothetical protein